MLRRAPIVLAVATGVLAVATGCDEAPSTTAPAAPSTTAATARASAPAPPAAEPTAEPASRVTLIAGGDVFFGRDVGQLLLARPDLDPFAELRDLLARADLRFANLESQLSDQGGVTENPDNHLIFTGPPGGADVLRRAGFDLVSTANNHMWDYGKDALFETFANLERVGVGYVGAGRVTERAYGPVLIERGGLRLAFLAVTDIWNQGTLRNHPAREFVAMADTDLLAKAIAAARPAADFVLVSYHGGSEYMEEPTQFTRAVTHAAIDAGADLVIGHHPHVVQGIAWYRGKPILYSLGNFTMGWKAEYPWGRFGYLARIALDRGAVPGIEVCPFQIRHYEPVPLRGGDLVPTRDYFFRRLEALSKRVAGSAFGSADADGCAPVTPPAVPFPGAVP
jgi:poly-gamma-glutamate capsule biosynthesis protein CapA/YwtB (metallophosphatase superfamily)